MFSQRHWPNCWCVARRPRREFATNSRIFWRKICAIAALNARFFRCATRRRRALELRRRLSNFKSESLQKSRKVCCAVRRNGENFAANSCVIDANFGRVLRMFDHWSARFRHRTRQQLDAEILQHQNVFAATPAEVLARCASTAQRIWQFPTNSRIF